jgi:hypothetical protein
MDILDQQHIPKFIIYRPTMIWDFYVLNVSFLNQSNIPALPNISPSTAFCNLPPYINPHEKSEGRKARQEIPTLSNILNIPTVFTRARHWISS